MYHTPFFITENLSSNAFSFERRINPKLYVPSVIDGTVDDVQVGDHVVFEDYDEYDVLQSCKGLKHLVKTVYGAKKTPVVIVDNHNHVFYFWYQALANGAIERGATLVHIDQHKGERVPEVMLRRKDSGDLQKVFEYTNTVLNVGNYIPPAMEEGLVGKLVSITSEQALRDHNPQRDSSLIVNIDLDFWAPEMDYIDRSFSLAQTKAWMDRADLITFATSPFFIEQERAIAILKELLL
ncbi:UPF0489 family protein [Candidatus Peregrinibacteria bacterium]|nr:MAG: UPF0489 family protein [Candidatus Peregrinibacteria bacterium]